MYSSLDVTAKGLAKGGAAEKGVSLRPKKETPVAYQKYPTAVI
jgi:hypothetical protein